MLSVLPVLCASAFLAGFFDAIVGGGGLVQLPALLVLLPDVPVATVLGTNKLTSLMGTSVAVTQYTRHLRLEWPVVLPATLAAFGFSFLGARAASLVTTALFRPVIFLLLIGVAAYVFWKKDFGTASTARLVGRRQLLGSLGVGVVLGFYDGIFGPGTGSFLIFAFIGLFGLSFLSASASAKVVNAATNLSAVAYFASTQHILYSAALPMAGFNILGSLLGTRLAILRGSRFIRVLFLSIISLIILKFGFDLFH